MSTFAARLLKRRSVLVALLLVLALTVTGALAVREAGAWLRTAAEAALQARLVPQVRIADPIGWSLLPTPSLTLRGLSLHGPSAAALLTAREITLRLEPGALWRGEIAVTALTVSGVELVLRRDAEGWDVARWLRPQPTQAGGAGVPIGRLIIEEARMRVEGELAADVEIVRLVAGPLAPGADIALELAARARSGTATLALTADARFRTAGDAITAERARITADGQLAQWRVTDARLQLDSLHWSPHSGLRVATAGLTLAAAAPGTTLELQAQLAELAGDAARWRSAALSLTGRAEHAGQGLTAHLTAPAVEADAHAWRLPQVAANFATTAPSAALTLEIAGTLTGDMAGATPADAAPVRLVIERGRARLPHPAGAATPLALAFAGAAQLDPARGAGWGTLAGGVDDSHFDGTWRFDAAAAPPLVLALSLDRLELDRYLPPTAADPAPADAAPVDLGAWRNWPVAADLRIGQLRVGGLTTEKARLRLSGSSSVTSAR